MWGNYFSELSSSAEQKMLNVLKYKFLIMSKVGNLTFSVPTQLSFLNDIL